MTLTAARRTMGLLIVGLTLIISQTHAQLQGPTPPSRAFMVKALEGLAKDDWSIASEYYPWQEVEQAFTTELMRRPGSSLASQIRKAAIQFDVRLDQVLIRQPKDLLIDIPRMPRFEVQTAIPYIAVVHVSLDGGEWIPFAIIDDTDQCTGNIPWPNELRPGVHRLQAAVDVAYLRKSIRVAEPFCGATGQVFNRIDGEDVLERERRVLSGSSFVILPNVLPMMPASSVETGLPEMPLATWLQSVVTSFNGRDTFENWHSEFCHGEVEFVHGLRTWHRVAGAARRQSRAVCLTWVPWIGGGEVAMRLRVATVVEDTGEWTMETPTFSDLSIRGDHRFVDMPFLAFLPQLFTTSIEHIPPPDLAIERADIRYEPARAKAGDPITITVTIRNIGGLDAHRRIGYVALEGGRIRAGRDFKVDVPANGKVEVSLPTRMPEAGVIVADVWAGPPPFAVSGALMNYLALSDEVIENNHALRPIGNLPPAILAR